MWAQEIVFSANTRQGPSKHRASISSLEMELIAICRLIMRFLEITYGKN